MDTYKRIKELLAEGSLGAAKVRRLVKAGNKHQLKTKDIMDPVQTAARKKFTKHLKKGIIRGTIDI